MGHTLVRRIIAITSSASALTVITLFAKSAAHINATTVAFCFLLVVLAVSSFADVVAGIIIAVLSGLLFNFYFLPPFGTFYIEAPENWVAFIVYTITAVVVSHFSATVRRRAKEADQMQEQLSSFSQLSQTIDKTPDKDLSLSFICEQLRNAFHFQYCAIYLFQPQGKFVCSGSRTAEVIEQSVQATTPKTLVEVITEEGPAVRYGSLVSHDQTIGVLVFDNLPLAREIVEATATIVSFAIQQTLSSTRTA